MTRADFLLPTTGNLPPFTGATEWLNSPPLTPAELRGKVVLVSFWTYTCINWLRTLPYLRAWAKKYKGQGLVIIGVHTPEFMFEHNLDNVREAVKSMDIAYPVVVDNKYAIWSAFNNHFWPALYFADATGRIRHEQFGEGEYEMSERVIQQLLTESGASDVSSELARVEPQGIELAADWENLESPETYLGYERGTNFASPGGIATGRRQTYDYDGSGALRLNQWALAGDWTVGEGAAMANEAHDKIIFRFHARDVNLVMGPVVRGSTVPFRVRTDGEAPQNAHGSDIDAHGDGTAKEQRLYQLIRQPQSITDRTFKIEFLGPDAIALAFTFGKATR